MSQFSAPWSRFLKLTSAGVTVLILGVFWTVAPISTVDESFAFKLFLYLLPIVLLGSSAIFIIRGYEIVGDNIEVIRVIGRAKIPIDTIERVEFNPAATDMSMRMMGNGGLYSFSGFFRNRYLGSYRAYVTNKMNNVVIYRKSGPPIVVSPGEPAEFIESINSRL